MVVINVKPDYSNGYWSRYALSNLGYLDGYWSRYSFSVGCVILYSGWSRMLLVPSKYVVNCILDWWIMIFWSRYVLEDVLRCLFGSHFGLWRSTQSILYWKWLCGRLVDYICMLCFVTSFGICVSTCKLSNHSWDDVL